MLNDKEVGARIKQGRKAAGLTQGHIAELISVSQETVSRIESGVAPLKAADLLKIAELIQMPLDYLTGRIAYEDVLNNTGCEYHYEGELDESEEMYLTELTIAFRRLPKSLWPTAIRVIEALVPKEKTR